MTPSEKEKLKAEFMLEQYRTAWRNIDNHRDGLWKLLVPYLGLTFLNYINNNYLSPEIMLFTIFFLNTFIMGIIINLNLWFVRNIRLCRNIETYFLSKEDYGKLIPEYFLQKGNAIPFLTFEIWIFTFFSILLIHITLWVVYVSSMKGGCTSIISIVFYFSLLIIFGWGYKQYIEYDKFVKDTKGYQ